MQLSDYNWYILSTRSGYEQKAKFLIEKVFDCNLYRPFLPMHECIFKFAVEIKKESKLLFPGYTLLKQKH